MRFGYKKLTFYILLRIDAKWDRKFLSTNVITLLCKILEETKLIKNNFSTLWAKQAQFIFCLSIDDFLPFLCIETNAEH